MSAADLRTSPAGDADDADGKDDATGKNDATGNDAVASGEAVKPRSHTYPDDAGASPPRWFSTRFFRSELWLIFGRRRNWVGLAILCAVPILVNVATKMSGPSGDGPEFFVNITHNGLFAALAALALELPLFLPIAVAAISADAIAGEANLGTLRYLLAVPAGRTRLLAVKFAAIVVFASAATLLVAVVGAVLGLILFGGGPMATFSGTPVSFGEGMWRVLLVCVYITVMLTALGAIGLFVSTLTEQPIGAAIAVLVIALGSEISDAIPQLSAIHRYLPTHYWLSFGDLLRNPIAIDRTVPGLLSALIYVAIFTSAAWARFGGRDVTS
ncbi:MAG TPA: ABC transporter permease [Micromonosporaceae bacterium]|nr:ABC transporter permease [Micromonosporaceae bacterium]